MTLEEIKKESFNHLIKIGYSRDQAQKTVNQYQKISGYYKGRPSKVILKNGIELYL